MLAAYGRNLCRAGCRWTPCGALATPWLARGKAAQVAADEAAAAGAPQDAPPPADTFRYADLTVTRTSSPQPKPALESLRFGQAFTDHMLTVSHSTGTGWSAPVVAPLAPLQLHPAAQVLHYGTSCFEGMKAYMGVDGVGRLFRPELNMARLRRSARRLLLADFDPTELLECVKALLRADRDWLPTEPGYSMYIRPFIVSTGQSLGVAPPTDTQLHVLLSPVGPYYRSGLRPITLWLDEEHVRAWPRGVGQYKIGGNYAPTMMVQRAAAQRNAECAQVLYSLPAARSDDPDAATLSESGAMNFFALLAPQGGSARGASGSARGRPELVTPPLDGTILPGVTRDSVLALARESGEFDVSERPISIAEVKKAAREGRLLEMFGCGTACVVQPVAALVRGNGERYESAYRVEDAGSLTNRLTKALQDIQYGREPHPWSVPFE